MRPQRSGAGAQGAGCARGRDDRDRDRRAEHCRIRRGNRELAGGRDPCARRGLPRVDLLRRRQHRAEGRRALPDGQEAVRGVARGSSRRARSAAGTARDGCRQPQARRPAGCRGRAEPEGPRRCAGLARCGSRRGRGRALPRSAGRDQPELHDDPFPAHRRHELCSQAAGQLRLARTGQPAHVRIGTRPDARQLQRVRERATAIHPAHRREEAAPHRPTASTR